MKTQKAIDTHNAIVDAAEMLFMKKSIENVTVSDITQRAGIAKGTFYIYFSSKDDLVWHFIEHKLDPLLQAIGAIGNHGYSKAEIYTVIDRLMEHVKTYEPLLKLIHQVQFFDYLGRNNVEKRYVDTLVEPVFLWMSKGKQEGKLDIEDPRFAAYFFTLSIHNLIHSVINQDVPYSIDVLGTNLKSILTKLLIER